MVMIPILCISITGDRFSEVVSSSKRVSKDLLPDISFVSLIGDATILGVSKLVSWFGVNDFALVSAVKLKDARDPP